jgi:uroporphyrin-III C-methyltransferase
LLYKKGDFYEPLFYAKKKESKKVIIEPKEYLFMFEIDELNIRRILERINENLGDNNVQQQLIQNPQADTLVYYMGRKDATNIAKQLIDNSSPHTSNTPVHILEAVSTQNERHWSSTLEELANGKANDWFDSASPALIMVGEALREKQRINQSADLQSSSAKFDDGLQDSLIFTDCRRSA